MVIHKQVLEITDRQRFNIKGLRKILSVDVQYNILTMWFLRDEEDKHIYNVKVMIHGTGHTVDPAGMNFMGTHLIAHGQLVWHVWTEII